MDLTKEEIPTEGDIAYLLTLPPLGQEAIPATGGSVIVFCMDISGSMGITSEVNIYHYVYMPQVRET